MQTAANLAQVGRFAEAIPLYTTVIEKYPEQIELWLQLANAYGHYGRLTEAHAIYQQFLQAQPNRREIRVRFAHALEDWQDHQGALREWTHILRSQETSADKSFAGESAFHRIRLLERANQISSAYEELSRLNHHRSAVWGWAWLEGNLARKSGQIELADQKYQLAFKAADGEHSAKCASALARLHDQAGNFTEAIKWLRTTVALRAKQAQAMREACPLAVGLPSIPAITPVVHEQRPMVFLTGFPRSGTTLLAHSLREHYHLELSEEFPYLKQLVENTIRHKNAPADTKPTNPQSTNNYLEDYWHAQQETGFGGSTEPTPLLDKNPSLGILSPHVLEMIPNAKIIWMERDMRDLWLSSCMLDVPINGASCWWQNTHDFFLWAKQHLALADALEAHLPKDNFLRVNYRDFINQPSNTIEQVASRFNLKARPTKAAPVLATSPSYAEITRPIADNRIGRWINYKNLLQPKESKSFEALADLVT